MENNKNTNTEKDFKAHEVEFDKIQFQQCFDTMQKIHNTQHFTVAFMLSADVTLISFAVKNESYLLISVCFLFPMIIWVYWFRIRKMSFAAFTTAISIEKKYADPPLFKSLASTFLAVVYHYDEYKKVIETLEETEKLRTAKGGAAGESGEEKDLFREKVSELQEMTLNNDFGKKSTFMNFLPLLALIHLLAGFILKYQDFFLGFFR